MGSRESKQGGRFAPLADWYLQIRSYLLIAPGLAVLLAAIFLFSGFLNVSPMKIAIMIRKTGDSPPNGSIVALEPGQKGIQLEPLPEGFYWRNPLKWDWVVVDTTEISEGRLGVKIRQYGKSLPLGEVIAGEGEKGIERDVLKPGRHRVNTLIHRIEISDAKQVPAGYVGVVTLLAGKPPANPNVFVVQSGEKGVQPVTLPPGSYYPNPYIERIDTVDVRSHRFDMQGADSIRFPSSDGFQITMIGTIEWYIDRNRVSEVFVKFVDTRDAITCVVEQIILPHSRAYSRIEGSRHMARDFISGETRQRFQDAFLKGLQASCAKQGVVIKSALVRDTLPPQEIANPIRQREIAIRERDKFEQEKEREIQQKQLSMEMKLMDRKTQVKEAETSVSITVTKAKQMQQVALIDAQRKLEVAKLQLEAAQNQAAAIVETGKAAADVVMFNNKAKASGIREARLAFKEGATYVRYLYYQKIAPALTYVLANTDGPFSEMFREFTRKKIEESGRK